GGLEVQLSHESVGHFFFSARIQKHSIASKLLWSRKGDVEADAPAEHKAFRFAIIGHKREPVFHCVDWGLDRYPLTFEIDGSRFDFAGAKKSFDKLGASRSNEPGKTYNLTATNAETDVGELSRRR